MTRCRSTRPAAWSVPLCLLAAAPLLGLAATAAAQGPHCLDRMALSGDAADLAQARQSLASGSVRDLPAESCDGAELHVARVDDRWQFELRKGGRSVHHSVQQLASMATWVESWLTPDAVPAEEDNTRTGPEPDPAEAEPAEPETVPAPVETRYGRLPLQLALRGMADLDGLAPAWLGGELSLRVGLRRHLWVGVAAAGLWSPEQRRVRRRALRFSARVGWLQDLRWGAVSLGGGVGIVSATARKRVGQADFLWDEEARAIVELVAGLDIYLSRHWTLSVAAIARGHLPDGFGDSTPPTPEDAAEPSPLPDISSSLLVGIGWDAGRSR